MKPKQPRRGNNEISRNTERSVVGLLISLLGGGQSGSGFTHAFRVKLETDGPLVLRLGGSAQTGMFFAWLA